MKQQDSTTAELAAAKCDLACEVLRSFGGVRFAATGWSMLPSIWPGDTLVVERANRDQIRVGDVVLVGREGRLCAHRVIGACGDPRNQKWITQGDAQTAPDPPVAESELQGRIAYLIREGRCVAVPAKLSAVEGLVAKVVRRSVPAARVLVYLHHMLESERESVLPCQS
jgi:signal peptidase I